MSKRRSTEERIAVLDKKMDPLRQKLSEFEKQKEALESAKKEAYEKARTHRLIQLGATIGHFLGREMRDEDVDYLDEYLKWEGSHTNYFTRAMNRNLEEKREDKEQVDPKKSAGKKESAGTAKVIAAEGKKVSAGAEEAKPTTNP